MSTTNYTCLHHNDQQRAACPVCLVASLTADLAIEREKSERYRLASLKLDAELAAERARLDWLAERWDNPLAINLHPSYGWSEASKNLRASIDAAMKEEA